MFAWAAQEPAWEAPVHDVADSATPDPRSTCRDCGSDDMVEVVAEGDLVCRRCGLVHAERLPDERPWVFAEPREWDPLTRCDRDLTRICVAHGVPDAVALLAGEKFRDTLDRHRKSAVRRQPQLRAACVRQAAKERGYVHHLDVCGMFGVGRGPVADAHKDFRDTVGGTGPSVDDDDGRPAARVWIARPSRAAAGPAPVPFGTRFAAILGPVLPGAFDGRVKAALIKQCTVTDLELKRVSAEYGNCSNYRMDAVLVQWVLLQRDDTRAAADKLAAERPWLQRKTSRLHEILKASLEASAGTRMGPVTV